jgi:hypothetical protein
VIDGVRVESEEDGFHLVLTGDLVAELMRYLEDEDATSVDLLLPQDAAVQLNAQVRGVVSPWVDTMNHERAAYDRATPEERAAVLGIEDVDWS